ncbi:GSU2403 family nucleotidyltransferase fold protein [Bradyrhizobium sp. USDA 10063]
MHTAMTREQRRLVETMRSTALDYGAAARARDEFGGGMQWLRVKQFEYLTRYRRDPITGEQKATSIGRRSPETEEIYDRFTKSRAELDERMRTLRPGMAEQARMARALRLNRAPEDVGAIARAIGVSEMVDHVVIIGEAAMYAYECEMAALLPREVLPDAGVDLLVAGVHPTDAIDELVATFRRARIDMDRPRLSGDRAAAELRTDGGLKIRLFTSSTLERMVDDYAEHRALGAEAARWALEQSPIQSILIDRQGRSAQVSVPEPRAWCILQCMALDIEEMSLIRRETSAELNSSMIRLVQERWPESFADDHLAAIPQLREALEEDGYPPAPRI